MRRIANQLLLFEPIIVLIVVYAFWFDPNRVWSLLLLVPLLGLRLAAHRRLVASTPLNLFLLMFLVLGIVNIYTAPMSRGNVTLTVPVLGTQTSVPWAWVMLGRPIMGMAVYFAMIAFARRHGLRPLLLFTATLALLLAVLALLTTQWNSKSELLMPIINLIPNYRQLTIASGGFNANELAGGLIWLTPLCAALAFYRWPPVRFLAACAFALLLFALFLGQSRLAIIGLVVALAVVIFLLIPRGRWRALALTGLALFIAAEAVVVVNPFQSQASTVAVQERDEVSNVGRLYMWSSAIAIVRDHPLTGIGANMYRDRQVRAVYPVPGYENGGPPHAHNEFLQIAADLGIPGLLVFAAWYITLGTMLVETWRRGDANARVVAVAAGAGLLAHALFGMGDAVALWDRFIWVFWWTVGIAGAQYVCVRETLPRPTPLKMPRLRIAPDSLEDATPG